MKIFLDTAHVPFIKQWAATGLVDGITTNPSNLSKEGGEPLKHIKEICAIMNDVEGDVSVEVTQTAPDAVYKQALEIAKIADNVVVKVPCHAQYYSTIHKLVQEDININITLLFSVPQALYMCKLGVYYISPFIGRLNDIDGQGMNLVHDIRSMIDDYGFETELLAASIRSVADLHQVILAGVDIATLPPNIFEESMQHPLTDAGIKQFTADWQKTGVKSFPE